MAQCERQTDSNMAVMLMMGNSKMIVHELTSIIPPFIPAGAHVMTQIIELPPGDQGVGAHRHSGPVFGYMLEGKMLFELEGEAPYIITAGEAFWEPGGDVVHYQAANLLNDATSKFLVVMVCAPDVPMITMLDDQEVAARSSLRVPGDGQTASD